ncbi:MAG TPA: hypothetical protein VGE66_02420 [Chitinophagaceae bacterium]
MASFVLYQFNQLDTGERFRWIVEDGVFLGVNRYVRGYRIALFSLYGYYVEVYIHTKTGTIGKVRPFFSYKKLDAFLPEVEIKEIEELL